MIKYFKLDDKMNIDIENTKVKYLSLMDLGKLLSFDYLRYRTKSYVIPV